MILNKNALAFIVLATFSGISSATIVQYDDQSSFVSDTSAISAGSISNYGLTTLSSSSAVVGSLSFTSATSGTTTHFLDWTSIISGNELAFGGVENFNIDISGGAYSLGFDAYEPTSSTHHYNGCNVSPCVDSTFAFALYSGSTLLDQFSFNLLDNALDFVGVHSDVMFNRVEIREIIGTNDNEFFGNFLIGQAALSTSGSSNTSQPVSAPATMGLLLLGVAGLAFWGKKSKSADGAQPFPGQGKLSAENQPYS